MIEIPPVVANKARVLGAHAWLAGLPDLVAGLERDWHIRVASPFDGGTEAYVAPATLADGTEAVLKLIMPRDESAADHEIVVLRIADGDGCARLYRADEQRGAMLLERLGPSLYDLAMPIAQRHEILTDLASRVWRPAADAGLPSGADKAAWLATAITAMWERLDRPCSERAVAAGARVRRTARTRARPGHARLVHGDVHQWNALQSRTGFALVDPDGLFADPEYDLGVIMREDPLELLAEGPRTRSAWLAARTGTDEARSGSGASSNGCRPACWPPRSSCSRSARRCCTPPTSSRPADRSTERARLGYGRSMTRILVADNDPDALDLAVLDLRLEGHEVVGAPGGDEALELVDTLRSRGRRARSSDAAGADRADRGAAAAQAPVRTCTWSFTATTKTSNSSVRRGRQVSHSCQKGISGRCAPQLIVDLGRIADT